MITYAIGTFIQNEICLWGIDGYNEHCWDGFPQFFTRVEDAEDMRKFYVGATNILEVARDLAASLNRHFPKGI